MKKAPILMGLSSLVLVSAAFLAAKPAKNAFTTVQAAFIGIGPNSNRAGLNLTSTHFTFFDSGSLSSVYLKTASNSIIAQLFTGIGANDNNPVFYKP